MKSPEDLRKIIQDNLGGITEKLNCYLRGENVHEIKSVLTRLGRGGKLPYWYDLLESGQSMPNLDGKTIGSVIEMTLVGTLEKHIFKELGVPPLDINPAKGVDIPFINLGIKSPSENYCTSEPFFSAYERLLGNEHDALILLTDYQTAKKNPPPIRIQIIQQSYLKGSEIADKNLCEVALKNRELLLKHSEAYCKKFVQFLAHVIQSDWRGKQLLSLLDALALGEKALDNELEKIEKSFASKTKSDLLKGLTPLDAKEIECFRRIKSSSPKIDAIINACNDWVIDTHKDFGRMPNDNEWQRFLSSPLDGKIGMSFALQWRYNFGHVFKSKG
tara:strand:+ start:1339 stop:2331 length:993 start_codon:yes stop_codon:yes gene_type:complete